MSERKRKRDSEGDTTSNATRNSSNDNEHRKVKVVHLPPNSDWVPVIASTPGLRIPSDLNWTAYNKKTQDQSSELLLHADKLGKIDYTARDNSAIGTDRDLKHYIGLFDPEKNEVQIMEAKSMSVRTTIRAEVEQVRQERIAAMPKDRSGRHNLSKEFGTKKAKKAISSIAENAITPRRLQDGTMEEANKALKNDATASAILDSMAKAAETAPSKEDTQAAIETNKPRPPINVNAKAPADVYSLNEMVSKEVLEAIKVKPWVDAIQSKENIQTESGFVTRRIADLAHAREIEKLKVLKYVLLVLTFFKACHPLKKGGRKVPSPKDLKEKTGIDDMVLRWIKNKFTRGGEMSKFCVDLLITTLAVLSLIVDDFQSDMYDLREDLKLKPAQIEKYFNEIGARTTVMTEVERMRQNLTKNEALSHRLAKLRLPLQFPKEKRPLAKRPGR